MKKTKTTSAKTSVVARNFALARKIALLGFALALFALPQQVRAAKADTITVATKSAELTSDGNKTGFRMDFDKKKWMYCIIKCNGLYHKDIKAETASQKFVISINGKVVINEDCLGEKIYTFYLDNPTDKTVPNQTIRVEGRMESVHGAIHTKGNIEVRLFTEEPEVFYVTKLEYTGKPVRTANEFVEVFTDMRINNSKQETGESITVRYTNKRSLTWQKTSSHAERFGFSAGYKAPDSGGIEGGIYFEETIQHSYFEGGAEERQEEQTYTSKFSLKPKEKHRMFVMQHRETWEVPYTMEAYVWDKDGKKTYYVINDKYIYRNSPSNTIMHDDPDSPEEPTSKEVKKTKWREDADYGS